MTRVRCPQNRCIFWLNGWCDSDEIELDPENLACLTFEEMDLPEEPTVVVDEELDWVDDESIFEDDLDESLYGYDDEEDLDDLDEEDAVLEEDDDWTF